jgi:hypothetical protein
MKKTLLNLIFLSLFLSLAGQEKMPLDHDVYENWKELQNPIISPNGDFISFEVNPQLGDGNLVIRNLKNGNNDTIPRGYKASFSYDSEYIVGMIKVPEDSVRKAKMDKKKPEDLFKDSLFVLNLNENKLEKFADVRSYKLSEEGLNLLVFHLDYIKGDEPEEEAAKDKNPDDETPPLQKNINLLTWLFMIHQPVRHKAMRMYLHIHYRKTGNY